MSDLVPIGEAARRIGVATSTLRYYDELGLVRPAARRGGRRLYGVAELRQLALVRVGLLLGFTLDEARRLLTGSGDDLHALVASRIADLTEQIRRAEETRALLTHFQSCPSPDPVRECPQLHRVLDAWIDPSRDPEPMTPAALTP